MAGHLVLGLLQALLQRRAAVEGGRPGAGPDAHAVVGHAVEVDQAYIIEQTVKSSFAASKRDLEWRYETELHSST